MLRKYALPLGIGLIVIGLLLAAGNLFQPIQIVIDGVPAARVQAPVLTVGQAVYEAGLALHPADLVTPGLDQPIPGDREIEVQRAVHVTLWENGTTRTIESPERDPHLFFTQAGVDLQRGDRVLNNGQEMDLSLPLTPGEPIVLQIVRARPVQMVINGIEKEAVVTGATPAHALWQAGIEIAPGDQLLPEPGEVLTGQEVVAYEAAQPLTIQVDEQVVEANTAADTVGQALTEAGVALQGLDYSQPAEDQPVPPDGQIQVVRVQEEIVLQEELIPYGSSMQPDPELELDQRRTMQAGQYGVKVIRERARLENGEEISRAVDSDWVASEPVEQTVGYGTLAVPKVMDTPDGQIEYYRAVQVYATSYSPCRLGRKDGSCNDITASGQTLRKGIVAVTLPWYRLFAGQQVYIPGYGVGTIADTGGGIPGTPWIDLGFSDDDYQPMLGWMTIYFLTPIPANVPWTLP